MKQHSIQTVSIIGFDLAKTIFQVHGTNAHGEAVIRRKLKRHEVCKYFAQIPECLIGMEACASAHYWSRVLSELGHTVRLMAPIHVKPYIKGSKNDMNDAEGICEAVQRPNMRFVSAKTPEQQAVLHCHQARHLLVGQRVALSNHMRGVLLEYGITLPQGSQVVSRCLPGLLENADNDLPMLIRQTLSEIKIEHDHIVEEIAHLYTHLEAWHAQSEASQRLAGIPGIGLLTATALAATIGDVKQFKNGRHLAAYLGLVPRQNSSGGKDRLLGISKRGNTYLRCLLVHGARSVIRHIKRRIESGQEKGNEWVVQLLSCKHTNVVVVALANKMARMAWALLATGNDYRTPNSNSVTWENLSLPV